MKLIRPGMGTENSSEFLSALIQFVRPNLIVEIGAGDSTLFIAKSLQKAKSAWLADKQLSNSKTWTERTALLDPSGIPEIYNPRLITIDDFSAEGQSAEKAWQTIKEHKIDESFITLVQENFFKIDYNMFDMWGGIDIAWIDAGTLADDVRFVATLWKHISPGGYLCLHEPTITTVVNIDGQQRVRRVRTPLWEEIKYRLDDSFEVLTIPENHKYRQSGFGIIRKLTNFERIVRQNSLQDELFELNELPLRSDLLPMGNEKIEKEKRWYDILNTMKSGEIRKVYSAISLGASNLKSINDLTKIDFKTINKSVVKLLNCGLVETKEGKLIIDESSWTWLDEKKQKKYSNMSDRKLETDIILSKISCAFKVDVAYTESEVSKICSLFTDDFARLRRCMVDSGFLTKTDNMYYLTVSPQQ